MKTNYFKVAFFAALIATCSIGCGDDATEFDDTSDDSCPEGTETCPCYGNGSCNDGLECLSGICVEDPDDTDTGTGDTDTDTDTDSDSDSDTDTDTDTDADTDSDADTDTDTDTDSDPQNMIQNGDFSQGGEYWEFSWQAGETPDTEYGQGEYCIYNTSYYKFLSFSLGYPPTPSDAFEIEPGVGYSLSYDAKGFGDVTAKIGQVSEPYDTVVSFDDLVDSKSYETFSHLVLSEAGETAAGLVFNGELDYGDYVCFDNVVLVKNP